MRCLYHIYTQCLHRNSVQLYYVYVHICTGHQRYVTCHSIVTHIPHVCGTLWSSLCDYYSTGMLCTFHTSLLSCWPCLGCQRNSLRHVCPCSACDVQNRRHRCGLCQLQPLASGQCDPDGMRCWWQHYGVSLLSEVFPGSDPWQADGQGWVWRTESPAWSCRRLCVTPCHPRWRKQCRCSSPSAWFQPACTTSCSF